MAEVGCGKPTGGLVGESEKKEDATMVDVKAEAQAIAPKARVGGKAPDFEAPGYLKGNFIEEKLSNHLGKWVLVCFYPGDFTFV